MSEMRLLPPGEDLVETVAGYLHPRDGNDFSCSVVVFPGKRPAHFLYKMLAGRAGTSIIPPRVYSIDHFVETLLREHLGVQTKMADIADAVAILHDVHLQLNAKLGGASYASLDAFLPLALKLFGELEEVALADISQRQLREMVQSIEYPKFHSLADYVESFSRELQRHGYITRSAMYQVIADSIHTIDLSPFDTIILAGFYAFTAVERRIVSHLRELPNVVLLFQRGPGIFTQLHSLNIDLDPDDKPSTAVVESPDLNFYCAPDTHGQIHALAATLQQKITSGEPLNEHSVVVLPSAETVFPVLHGPLSLLQADQYNISLGYPLVRTPVFGFLNSLVDLIAASIGGKFPAHAYLHFALHPYTKNIRFRSRSDLTRILFHRIEEFLVEHKARFFLTLDELEGDPSLYDFVVKAFDGLKETLKAEELRQHVKRIHDETIRKFQSFTSLGDFAQKCMSVLMFIFDESTASIHPYFRPYAVHFIDLLDRITSSLLREKRFDTTAGYFTFFRQYVATEFVPFTGTPVRGLQILGLLETRNLKFDTVYILDANDDIVPSKPAEDLLLPQPVRAKLGLETSRDRERLSQYYFDLVVQGARDVHIYYTETKTGGKEKSRFVQKLIWNKEREARHPLENELELKVKYRMSLVNPRPQSIRKTPAVLQFLRTWNRFSASQLDSYLRCPLRFYHRTVLGLKEKAEPSEDIDQRDVGNVIHRILRQFFAPTIGQALDSNNIKPEDLEAAITRCFTEEYGTDLFGPSRFFRTQVSLQLQKFIRDYQLPLARAKRVVVTAVERKLSVEKNGLRFTGLIDRIEARDSKLFILDYKTGKDDSAVRIRPDKLDIADHASWRDAIGSLQLPMYMLLYSQANDAPIETIAPAYLFLGRNEIGIDCEVGIGSEKYSATEVYQAVEPVIFALIGEILDPNIAFEPTNHVEEECPQCPYAAICGTRWARGWRRE